MIATPAHAADGPQETLRSPADVRALFPAAQRYHYLQNFHRGPLSTVAQSAVERVATLMATEGVAAFPMYRQIATAAREALAEFLDAPGGADEVAFFRNTADAVCAVANGMKWREGDEILITDREYPGNVYPWMNLEKFGARVRVVPCENERMPVAAIEAALGARTRLVATSAVYFSNGYRLDAHALAAVCRRHGAILLLDAVQSLATEPLSCATLGADYIVGDARKFIGGMDGVGFLWGRREMLAQLTPAVVGAESVVNAEDRLKVDFTLRDDARKFEPGAHNTAGLAALEAALSVWRRTGLDRVRHWIRDLREMYWAAASQIDGITMMPFAEAERSAIVMLRVDPARIPELKARAERARVLAGFYPDGRVVIGLHAFVLPTDVAAMLAVLTGTPPA